MDDDTDIDVTDPEFWKKAVGLKLTEEEEDGDGQGGLGGGSLGPAPTGSYSKNKRRKRTAQDGAAGKEEAVQTASEAAAAKLIAEAAAQMEEVLPPQPTFEELQAAREAEEKSGKKGKKDKKGKFGRWLGELWIDDMCVNDWLLTEGYAEVYK